MSPMSPSAMNQCRPPDRYCWPENTRSVIAPSLPEPPVGPNPNPRQYLMAAERAIAAHQTGMAQEALERAESRLLDRSVAQGQVNSPDDDSAVAQITAARHALASGDLATASNSVQSVLSSTRGDVGQPVFNPNRFQYRPGRLKIPKYLPAQGTG